MDKEFVVNTYTNGYQSSPDITSLIDGGFVIAWTSPDQTNEDQLYYWGNDIHAQRYEDNGQPIGEEFLVNSYTDGYQSFPAITGLIDGGFVVTWAGQEIYAQRYDSNSQPVGEEFLVNRYVDSYPSPAIAGSLVASALFSPTKV